MAMPPGGWAHPRSAVGIPPDRLNPHRHFEGPIPRCQMLPPQARPASLVPPPPIPSLPYPLPYPHAHPHAPDHTSHSPDDSSFLRRQSLPLRRQGDLAPPTTQSPASAQRRHAKTAGRLWVQGLPCQGVGAGLALPRCGCRACPALFPFVDFGPSFTEALGLRSARALADTTCSPLSIFPTPSNRGRQPPSRPCLADTVRLPLSTCPSRLNPKLRRAAPGTGRPEKRAHTIPIKSNRPLPCRRKLRVQGLPWPVDTLPAGLLPSHAHIDQTQ